MNLNPNSEVDHGDLAQPLGHQRPRRSSPYHKDTLRFSSTVFAPRFCTISLAPTSEFGLNWHAPGRHLLARLTNDGEENGIVFAPGDEAALATVLRWRRNGWPAIVRRESRELRRDGLIPLGIALPPSAGKRRVSFWAERGAIASVEAPPLLCNTIASAPREWRLWLGPVVDRFAEQEFSVFVYGALLWQYLTEMKYIREGSDLDLLCLVAEPGGVGRAVSAFQAAQAQAPIRLDGEVCLPGLGWAAWRELAQSESHKILIKHDEGEYLIERSLVFRATGMRLSRQACGACSGIGISGGSIAPPQTGIGLSG